MVSQGTEARLPGLQFPGSSFFIFFKNGSYVSYFSVNGNFTGLLQLLTSDGQCLSNFIC